MKVVGRFVCKVADAEVEGAVGESPYSIVKSTFQSDHLYCRPTLEARLVFGSMYF